MIALNRKSVDGEPLIVATFHRRDIELIQADLRHLHQTLNDLAGRTATERALSEMGPVEAYGLEPTDIVNPAHRPRRRQRRAGRYMVKLQRKINHHLAALRTDLPERVQDLQLALAAGGLPIGAVT